MAKEVITPADARILVVEDDENNRLVAVMLLKIAGVKQENIVAIDGDPLPFLRDNWPDGADLILLDLQLPNKDGYEILAELRADPNFADIPVVAMTANVMKTDVEQVQNAGFNSFIGKPINGPLFGDWIARILAGEKMWKVI